MITHKSTCVSEQLFHTSTVKSFTNDFRQDILNITETNPCKYFSYSQTMNFSFYYFHNKHLNYINFF